MNQVTANVLEADEARFAEMDGSIFEWLGDRSPSGRHSAGAQFDGGDVFDISFERDDPLRRPA